jgi:hypothetical protein
MAKRFDVNPGLKREACQDCGIAGNAIERTPDMPRIYKDFRKPAITIIAA